VTHDREEARALTADAVNHPDVLRLREFAAGTLGDDDLDQIAAHLEACAPCRKSLDGFLGGDAFLDRLRSAKTLADTYPETEEERRRAARALRRDALRSSGGDAETASEPPPPPAEVGDYLILREVGRGGMGVVYHAQHRGLRRMVALKMILAGGFASEAQRERFRREAELAARVQHPNIVQVYDVGLHDGRPFLAMEWVAGGTLADRRGGEPWPAREAAGFLESVARAIEAAHQRGVVHRDLKPSNILLQDERSAAPDALPADAIPKIADFGLARALDAETGLTSTGMAVGTPEYMAPEQASGKAAGPAADIYALGAVLYQLLTGHPPFRGDTPADVLQAVAFAEPVAPRRFRSGIPRDLETIALKALEKEPARRYATAAEMAEDLRRFRNDEPIRAQPPGAWDRMAKWARRRPALAALCAVLAAVIALSLTGITALWLKATAAANRASAAAVLAAGREEIARRASYRTAVAAAAAALELNNTASARSLLAAAPAEYHNWEWRHFSAQLDNAQIIFRPDDGAVHETALAPAGSTLAYSLVGGRDIRLWSLSSKTQLAVLRGLDAEVQKIRFSPDGTLVAGGSRDGAVCVWDVASQRTVVVLPAHGATINNLVFSPDGSRLACIPGNWNTRIWDIKSGRCLSNFRALRLRFGPDSRRVVASIDVIAHIRDTDTGAAIRALAVPDSGVHSVAFSPDGTLIATGTNHPLSAVCVWNVDRDDPPAILRGHKNAVYWLTFSPDSKRIASMSSDKSVRIWDIASRKAVAVMPGHATAARAAEFSPDGGRLVTAGLDGTVRVFNAVEGTLAGILRCHGQSRDEPDVSEGAAAVAIRDQDGAVSLWDVDLAMRRSVLLGHTSYVYDATFGGDGRTIASAAWDGTVRLWDADTGLETCAIKQPEMVVTSVALSRDCRRIASFARHGTLGVWDRASKQLVWSVTVDVHGGIDADFRAVFNARGDLLAACGSRDGTIRLFDAASGSPAGTLVAHQDAVSDVAFAPDGSRLASGDSRGTLRIWKLATRAPVASMKAHDERIHRVAFSHDGRLVATASHDKTVRLWDAATLRNPAVLKHEGPVYGVDFCPPDDTRLAAACADNTVRLWDVSTFEEVAELRGHADYVHAVGFSPDGSRLVSCSGDYTVRVWDSLSPSERGPARH
jgi:eukaryotic-like serine/threonine-protein kinase